MNKSSPRSEANLDDVRNQFGTFPILCGRKRKAQEDQTEKSNGGDTMVTEKKVMRKVQT